MPQGTIRLNFQNAVIFRPHNRAEMKAVQRSFGLFGDPPSSSGFDPATDVPRDVIPKPEDYIYVPFRMISATILGADTWKATDFSDEKILKGSLRLLENKPVYVNHNLSDVMNNVGVITAPRWQEKMKVGKDIIPAGINGMFKIDAKAHPQVARNLLSEPPSIQSDSVTIIYQYEPSHTFATDGKEDDWEFERRIGTLVNGKMVRRMVTAIEDYIEVSLVSMGADPFGKILVDENGKASVDGVGVPLNIDRSSIAPASAYKHAKFDQDPFREVYEKKGSYFVSFCYDKENIINLKKNIIGNSQTSKKSNVMDEILEFLAAEMGVAESDVNLESFKKGFKLVKSEDFTKMKASSMKVLQLEKQVESLTEDKTTLTEKVKEEGEKVTLLTKEKGDLEPHATFGKTIMQAKKEEAKRLYRLNKGTKADEAFIGIIDKSDEKELNSILQEYGSQLTEKFTGVCKKCQSTEIDFRSSTIEDPKDEPKEVKEKPMVFSLLRK